MGMKVYWHVLLKDNELQCISVLFVVLLSLLACITETYLYNFDPLKPYFCIEKLGFTGVYIIFLISVQNIHCGYSLELPQ